MKPNEVSQNKAEVTDGFLAPIQNSCYVMEYLLGMPGNKKADILYYTNA